MWCMLHELAQGHLGQIRQWLGRTDSLCRYSNGLSVTIIATWHTFQSVMLMYKRIHVWFLMAKPILMTHVKQYGTDSQLDNYQNRIFGQYFLQKLYHKNNRIFLSCLVKPIQYFCTGKWIVTFLWPQCMSTLIPKEFIQKENIYFPILGEFL